MSNAAVETPLGVKLLSIAVGIWPASWLGTLVYALWDDYRSGRLADEDLNLLLVEILFCIVLIFMLSSVAVGLWKLEEGARKVALVSCLVFFLMLTIAFVMAFFDGHSFSGELTGLVWFVSWYLGFGVSAWYLHSKPIRTAFNRIETLGLTQH